MGDIGKMGKLCGRIKGIIYIILISCILVVGDALYILYIQQAGYPFEDLEPAQIKKVVLRFDDMPNSHRKYPTYALSGDEIKQFVDILHNLKIYKEIQVNYPDGVRRREGAPALAIYLNDGYNFSEKYQLDSMIGIWVYKQHISLGQDYRVSPKELNSLIKFYMERYQHVRDTSKGPSYPFQDLTLSQVEYFKTYYYNTPCIFPEDAKEKFVNALRDVVIYDVEENLSEYAGFLPLDLQMELKDGTCVKLYASDNFFIIDNVCYRSESRPNRIISRIYDDYFEDTIAEAKAAERTP